MTKNNADINTTDSDVVIKAQLAGFTPDASTTRRGTIRIATDEEAVEGIADDIAITPHTLAVVTAGMGVKAYTHTQAEASTEWTITHNMGKYPSVTVVDSAGSEVIVEVNYINNNTCVLSMTAPFKGKAYLN